MNAIDFNFNGISGHYQGKGEKPNHAHLYAKKLYIENKPSSADCFNFLTQLDCSILQKLYLLLKDYFEPHYNNEDRLRIIAAIQRIPETEWSEVLQQTRFIIPKGSKGHDFMAVIEDLVATKQPYRKLLVHTANRLFSFDTLSIERFYILNALTKMTIEELLEVDLWGQEKREKFKMDLLPNFENSRKIAIIYDDVLQQCYHLQED